MPGLKVLAPYNSEDAKCMLKAAIRDDNPVVFLEHELMYGEAFPVSEEVLNPDYVYENGKAKIDATQCVGCGVCEQLCKFGALKEV